MLRPEPTKPAADGEADRDMDGKLQVNVTCLVVGPEGKDADGHEQGSEGCSLRGLLRHPIQGE